jgi:hypothetical protein
MEIRPIKIEELSEPLPKFVSEGVADEQFKCLVLLRHKGELFSVGIQADLGLIQYDRRHLDMRFKLLSDVIMRRLQEQKAA